MEGTKQDWEDYEKILIKFDYTPEQIESVKEIRENYDHCTFEMFCGLIEQGIVVRTRKLKKKKRNMYVSPDGFFFYLEHQNKKMEYAGYFKSEE